MTAIPKRIGGWRSAPLVVFAAAIMIVLVGVGVIIQTDTSYRDARKEFARSQAQLLAVSVSAAIDFNDPVAAQEAVNPLRVVSTVRSAAVYGRDGGLVAGYDRTGEAVPVSEQTMAATETPNIRASVPIESSGQRIGTAYIELDRQPVWRRVSRYGTLAVLVAAAALIVVGLGFAQRALRNANRELAHRAEALAQANEMLGEQMEERAKAEDQLRQSQKMQALGQLTGGIAHDFNNLLTVIQGSADMLCKKDLPEPKRIRFASAIVHAAENAASLTSQLLAFARRQPLKPERLDLDQVLAEMRDLIDRTMGERVQVSLELDGPACSVEVDKAQLQSAILNIASNARDAMTDGGRLTISTREVNGPAGPMVAVDVADSGHGMDAETLDRVFEPFFTTKGAGKGTGLGLSQVYGFASQSGGEVLARSEPGRGTIVSLLLPCLAETGIVDAGVRSERAAGPQRPAAILVVEDNEEVGAFAESLLSELGHRVTRTSSGEAALELSRAQDFDLVFSDVVMPGMGGLKLAAILAEEKPALPVVLATGYSEEITETGSGGRPVILKPYRLATLSEVIASALNGGHEAAG
jgi:signal transduction histidine kinase